MAGYDNNKLGELRPNQIITTFGPGAIVDAVKDLLLYAKMDTWMISHGVGGFIVV